MLIDIAFIGLLGVALLLQVRRFRGREREARAAVAHGGERQGPRAQHPRIDITHCIGCGACADACPEGEVLGVVGGKAALVHPECCVGHGLCADACPVGAITIVMAPPSLSADTPVLSGDLETTVPGLFVAGELSGLALIKNAVGQGRDAVDAIARRLSAGRGPRRAGGMVDVAIVGAGPAGFAASLRAKERGLSYLTFEQGALGGSVAKFPRQKLVLTSPFELPLYGAFRKLEISKEALLGLWTKVAREARLAIRTETAVEQVRPQPDGSFALETTAGTHRARAVLLALGRRGTPRRLGIPGEELPHVMYELLDAGSYRGKRILVVGGGDSAVEAALGLAHQPGNQVTLSYRREAFVRLKGRNAQKIAAAGRRLTVWFRSTPLAVRPGQVELDVAGARRTIPNDFVWIFAGGTSPATFLERIGVEVGQRANPAA